jgi:hypothetical protein
MMGYDSYGQAECAKAVYTGPLPALDAKAKTSQMEDAMQRLETAAGDIESTANRLYNRLETIVSLPSNDAKESSPETSSYMLDARIYQLSQRIFRANSRINNIIDGLIL